MADWLVADGQAGKILREFDWSSTSLGPLQSWPQSLRTAVNFMIAARQPVYIAWGPELWSMYNDCYLPIVGEKHPVAMGQTFQALWSEIWDEYRPYVEAVMAGEAHFWVDQPFMLTGRPDRPIGWFTVSWTPLRDEQGVVAGFMSVGSESTERVLAERQLVESMDEGFCVIEIIQDEESRPVDYRFIRTNPAFVEQTGLQNAEGKLITELVPGIERHWIERNSNVAITGQPIRFVSEAPSMNKWFDCYSFPIAGSTNRVGSLFRNITERRRTEDKLRETAQRLEFTLEAAQVGDWDLDLVNDRSYRSLRHDQCFGYTEPVPDWGFETFIQHVHPDDRDMVAGKFESALTEMKDWRFECRVVWPDKTVHWIGAHGSIYLVDGKPTRMGGIVFDITERRQAEEALRTADQRKDEFLAMLAHELRNPLAPIAAAADLLQLAHLDQARIKQTSDIIARQVRHMTGLVDDLLDVSRVTRGLVTLEKSDVDIKRVVASAVEQVGPLIEAKRHHLLTELAPGTAHVLGDQKRLVQVVANLLNNAAKYTAEGGHLALTMEANDRQILLHIKDDGSGIAPELQPSVFDLFSQASRSADRSQGGLGIGLALVRSLVDLHGGKVSCFSQGLGKGSCFTVTLPRRTEHVTMHMEASSFHSVKAAQRRLQVLLVDDNVDAARMLALLLEAVGHDVLVEHSSLNALKTAGDRAPDVCILDIGLPDIDGYQLAQRLRARPGTASCLLVAVTGYGQEQDRKRAITAGFDHHLVKPVDTTALTSILSGVNAR